MKSQTLTDTSREQAQSHPLVRRESLAEAAERLREEARRKGAQEPEADTSQPHEASPRPAGG
jgi:hypothetical protein